MRDYKASLPTWGMAGAPLIDGNQLICLVGGADNAGLRTIDIQNDQVEAVAALVADFDAALLQQVPVVPMQLESIKGRSVREIRNDPDSKVSRWALNRDYRSTYRDHLTDTETLVGGQWHGATSGDTVFISLDQNLGRNLKVELGDEITFDVQGLPITTRVGSLRSVDWQRVMPNFLAVFPTGVLEPAPQFHVLVTRADSTEQMAALHAQAFQVPRPWSAEEFRTMLERPGTYAIAVRHDINGIS